MVFEDAVSGVQAALNGGFRVVGIGDANTLGQANFILDGFDGFTMGSLVDRLS